MNSIPRTKKFITTAELKNMGYSYYKIGRFEETGVLQRVNRTTYENLAFNGDENDFFSAEAFVPNGVICLMSAARYYELTTFLPDAVDVAIERKKKVNTLPEWPAIRIYYFNSARMEIGVREVSEDGNTFHIFDIEKTVIDIIYYRNKVGIEETSEVLNNYLKRRERQIDKLYAYAKQLRCEKVVRTYLEVLL
jgi:predicted transcriptional regulator of viral defense system